MLEDLVPFHSEVLGELEKQRQHSWPEVREAAEKAVAVINAVVQQGLVGGNLFLLNQTTWWGYFTKLVGPCILDLACNTTIGFLCVTDAGGLRTRSRTICEGCAANWRQLCGRIANLGGIARHADPTVNQEVLFAGLSRTSSTLLTVGYQNFSRQGLAGNFERVWDG